MRLGQSNINDTGAIIHQCHKGNHREVILKGQLKESTTKLQLNPTDISYIDVVMSITVININEMHEILLVAEW